MYEKGILPVMDGLDDQMKSDIEQRSRELLVYSWTEAAGEDCTAAVDTYLQDSSDLTRDQMELLTISYAVDGPKVSSKEKKALAALSESERACRHA